MTTPESKGPAVIDATTLAERLGRHEPVTVLDVRRPERWSEDRDCIPGAAWVLHEGAAGAGRTALGARLLGRAGLIRKFDQVHGAILERLERLGVGHALPDPLGPALQDAHAHGGPLPLSD